MTTLYNCKNNDARRIEIIQYLDGMDSFAINVKFGVSTDNTAIERFYYIDGCDRTLMDESDNEIIGYIDGWAFDDFSLHFIEQFADYEKRISFGLADIMRIEEYD